MSERTSMFSLGFDARSNIQYPFRKSANCRSTFDTLHGNDGRKGSTALSMSTISRATRVLTYRFNEVLHRGRRYVNLSRWFPHLAESVTLISSLREISRVPENR